VAASAHTKRVARAVGLLIGFVLLTVVGGYLVPADPYETHRRDVFSPPSLRFPLGSDELGRDILARVFRGSQISLATAAVALSLALAVGAPIGLICGLSGGIVDVLLMRVMDIWLTFPAFLLAIALAILIGPGTVTAMLAVGFVSIPRFARVVRSRVIELRQEAFVEAAIAVGAPRWYWLFVSIMPNTRNVILVQCALTAGQAVLMEASLSYLGLGTSPPAPSWGLMLKNATTYLSHAPWYGIFPGLFLATLILLMNRLGNVLNELSS